MGRLFAGTPLDRPPRCERCGAIETDCACPPLPVAKLTPPDPSTQTARIRLEKRPRGKVATLIEGLDPASGNDLPALAARLKTACGTGGTVKEDHVEIQGDHREQVATELTAIGYRVRR